MLTLGRILSKEALAREKAGEIDAKIKQVREVTAGRPEKR